MHPAVLDAISYTLLLSSFITLSILLWKGYKRKEKSPFYVLSASDVFSATLTAILLLLSHVEAGIRLSYNWQNNTSSDTPNRTWTIEDDYRFSFLQMHDLGEVDLNVTLTCGTKDILMQYGLLLAALANAFISLLTFTVQCNLNAAGVKRRCANVMKSSLKNTQLEPKSVEVKCRESEILEDEQESAFQPRSDDINAKTTSNVIQRIMKISKFRTPKEVDKKPTSLLVTSHWLVPLLVAGILYFAEYNDTNDVRHPEDIECVFGSNFPMSDFDTFFPDDNVDVINPVSYTTPPESDYFLNEKLLNTSKPSSVEIDEVVFKVQSIIKAALNYTRDSAEDTGITNSLNPSGPQNLTQYILTNSIMRYIKNITNITSVVNGTPVEQDVNVHNSATDNIHLNQDPPEVPLFYDVSENATDRLDAITPGVSRASAGTKDGGDQEDAQIQFVSTEESTTRRTANVPFVRNATLVSNDQIYDEIMKRIQAASVLSSAKNHYNRPVSRPKNGNQPDVSDLKNYTARRRPNAIKALFSNKNDNRDINAETKRSGSLRMTNECLVSTKFLKLQLFVLSFAIYFLPILLACILQMRGKHVCKNTLAVLRADLTSTGVKQIRQDSVESTVPQGSRSDRSRTDVDATKKESRRENESVALEVECMVRIFDTVKLSLILCVILWTPVFLGTLLRVYSCTRAPQWLTDVTFLSAVSFGIVRNALNVNIIKIQEACSDANTKENRIHPVE